jgi:hypothetical protein
MFQLVVDLVLVGGILWLFLTGIFWIKEKISPAPQAVEPENPSEDANPADNADTK